MSPVPTEWSTPMVVDVRTVLDPIEETGLSFLSSERQNDGNSDLPWR
jgi:hypothetical protein